MDVLFDAPTVLPALLTPFDERGDVDPAALREHVEFLIEGGVHGIMPCGTTGETALLEPDEVITVVTAVVEAVAGRVPVVAHVGRPSTKATGCLIERADPYREPRHERCDGRRQRQGDQEGKQRAFFHG